MAQRRPGSSRKSANTSPMIRLVAASMALAFGRSIVTSSTVPRRSVLMGLSLIGLLSQSDQGINGDSALARWKNQQGIDLELLERFPVRLGEASHGHYGAYHRHAVARPAAVTVDEVRD